METKIEKLRNIRDYENLKEILGKELGSILYEVINQAEKWDKELNIVHEALTELYDCENGNLGRKNHEIISEALNKISLL